VKPSQALYKPVARPQVQVIRIGENHFRAKIFKIIRAYRLDGSAGADRHKNRSQDFPPVDCEFTGTRAASAAGMYNVKLQNSFI
jgi:hypothetical protein